MTSRASNVIVDPITALSFSLMNSTENRTMNRSRPYARLALVALAFVLACGEPTAPATPAAVAVAPVVRPDANLVDITNGILNLTNGLTTLIGDLLPCNVTTDQWNTANIGPEGGRLNVGPHSLVIPRGALRSRTQITAHAVRGNHVRVDFSPSGLQFSQPASLTLSYAACKVLGKPVEVVYLKSDTTVTEKEPSKDYREQKWVLGTIKHFSSYAVAY
jgi:hypothetical protein